MKPGGISNIFWNAHEKRIRAGWRVVLMLVIWFLIVVVFLLGIRAVLIPTGIATLEEILPWEIWIEAVATLPAFWLGGRLLDRRKFADFGLHLNKSWFIDFGFGLFLGGLLVSLIFLALLAAGWVTVTGTLVTAQGQPQGLGHFTVALASSVGLFLLIGFNEELMCRGYLLTNLAEGLNFKRTGPRWGIVQAVFWSAALFSVLHLLNDHTTAVSSLSVFTGGIVLAAGYVLTGELAIPIGFHTTWKLFQANVFGFPVSGEEFSSATLLATTRNGPELWVGDAFGPESGLLAFAAVGLGCVLILAWVRWRYGRIALFTAIALPPHRENL